MVEKQSVQKSPNESPQKPNEVAVKKEKRTLRITPWWKEILLTIINVALIILTFIYLGRLPDKAKLAKEQRNSTGPSRSAINLELAKFEVESSKEKYEALSSLFPDEKRLLDFISQIDALKAEGFVSYFAFASESVVREKSGFVGYPFVLEFQGSLSQISDGLEKLKKLPFLLKGVNISLEREEVASGFVFRYGGFLYVEEPKP